MKYWKIIYPINDFPLIGAILNSGEDYIVSTTHPVYVFDSKSLQYPNTNCIEVPKQEYETYIMGKWKHDIDVSFITTTFIDNIRSYATYELLSNPQNTNVEIIKHLQTIQNALAANDLESEVQDTVWTTVSAQTKNNVLQLIRRFATDADSIWDKAFQFWHQIYTFFKLSTNQGNKDILNQLELANGLLAHN